MEYQEIINKCGVGDYIELTYEHIHGNRIYEGRVIGFTKRYLALYAIAFDIAGQPVYETREYHMDEIRNIKMMSIGDYDLGV